MRRVILSLSAATTGFLIYGLAVGNASVNYYVPVTVVMTGVIWLIHRSAHFSMATLWALAAIAVGNMAGGLLLIDGAPLYELALVGGLRFDKLYHAVATGVGAWASYEAITRWSGQRRPALILAAVMMASGAGAFVEIVEFVGTLLREKTYVGGYVNNMEDLVANTIGAVIASFAAYRWHGGSTQPT